MADLVTPDPSASASPEQEIEEGLRVLIQQWRDMRAHTYTSENADLYRAYDHGVKHCADQLESFLVDRRRGSRRKEVE